MSKTGVKWRHLQSLLLEEGFAATEIETAVKELCAQGLLLTDSQAPLVFRTDSIFTHALLVMTTRCVHCCTYCFSGQGASGRGYGLEASDIEDKVIERTVDWLLSLTRNAMEKNHPGKLDHLTVRPMITFFGGEPFLVPEKITHCIKYAEERAGSISDQLEHDLHRNITVEFQYMAQISGSVFDNGLFELFSKYKDRIGLAVSFNGTPDIQRATRPLRDGRDPVKEALRNVKRMRQMGFDPGVQCIVFADSIHRIGESLRYLIAQGFTRITLTPYYPHSYENPAKRLPEEQRTYKYFREAYEIAKENQIEITQFGIDQSLMRPASAPVACGAGVGMIQVFPDGTAVPCVRFGETPQLRRSFSVGNIKDFTEDPSNHFEPEKTSLVDALRRRHVPNIAGCETCEVQMICRGGCPIDAFYRTGDFRNRSQCKFRYQMARHLLSDLVNSSIAARVPQ